MLRQIDFWCARNEFGIAEINLESNLSTFYSRNNSAIPDRFLLFQKRIWNARRVVSVKWWKKQLASIQHDY